MTTNPYALPEIVALRNRSGASVCIDEDCELSGGYSHVGPCEPCACPMRHAIEECTGAFVHPIVRLRMRRDGWKAIAKRFLRERDVRARACAALVRALAQHEPYSAIEVLRRLAGAVEHARGAHDCDHHGWEGDGLAVTAARLIADDLERALGLELRSRRPLPERTPMAKPVESHLEKLAVVAFIEREDGRFLCVWNLRYGGWGMPGGRREPDEGPEEALGRELAEEVGLTLPIDGMPREVIYHGPHGLPRADSTRASNVRVYRVPLRIFAGAMEERSPIAWLTRAEFLRFSPFAPFYSTLMALGQPLGAGPASPPEADEGSTVTGIVGWLSDRAATFDHMAASAASKIIDPAPVDTSEMEILAHHDRLRAAHYRAIAREIATGPWKAKKPSP